ncbi:hypothetical protein GTZ99_13925 [Novosphingobium sp. FSY-8]|uniref:Acetyltransferase-like isoleucine patch superfamily enzyme n=2 Tax=Novosphingobium ovatum TaxID=1908523 RepID=A0ABW9XGH0_9SPHN|nr:hypothetical protein [Novosphingobium ovatum]
MHPMRVRDEVIVLCRDRVEPSWKRKLRALLHSHMVRKLKLAEAGEGFQWAPNEAIVGARFGRYASIGHSGCFHGPVVVGDLTMISTEVQVIGNDHLIGDAEVPMRYNFPSTPRPVTVIESDVWIGSRVTIMEGVRIGRGSVIGSNAMVTRDIPPYSVAMGIPARVVRPRFTQEEQDRADLFLYGKVLRARD